MYNHFAKQFDSFIKIIQLYNLEIPLLGIYSREINAVSILVHKCSILFIIDKIRTTKIFFKFLYAHYTGSGMVLSNKKKKNKVLIHSTT